MRALLRPIHLFLSYSLVHGSPRRRISGFLVSCWNEDFDCEAWFAYYAAALDLIRTYDLRRFERMQRDVKVIALTTRGLCYYEPALRTVFLDVDVLTWPLERVATALIHEATHARLRRRLGARSYMELRERHERLCVAQEVAFARRLPDSEHLVKQRAQVLDSPLWTETAWRAKTRLFVERHSLPDWVERFMNRFGAR